MKKNRLAERITETAQVTYPNGNTETRTVHGGVAGRIDFVRLLNMLYPCGKVRIKWNAK